jgi:flagellar hook-associated protein 3 FlgL
MRIATSTVYTQQALSIDNLETQVQNQGQNLSTGKSLNVPSDAPTQIAADLNVRTTISVENQQTINIQAATAQLTSTDSALASLTSILQSSRQLATRGASDLLALADRQTIGAQVDQYLQQAVAIANTQYGGSYIFAGSVQSSTAPVTTSGTPISAVNFSGNEQTQAPMLFNGQSFTLSPTLQQAFNYNATNGSPSVFDMLITLRDTLDKGLVTDQSAQSINHPGQVIYGAGSPTPPGPTTLGTATPFDVQPKADSAGTYSISISSTGPTGLAQVQAYTFSAGTPIDDGVVVPPGPPFPANSSIVSQINANSGTTGLSAAFNVRTQRLSLTNVGGGAFSVSDIPSPAVPPVAAATKTSNFMSVFKLTGTASLPQTVSTQLGDIDNALDVTLNARALVGSRMNALAQINTQVSTDVVDNTSVQSGIEDTDVAKATTEFTATQTALTASYSTTTRLEAKDLFDYL